MSQRCISVEEDLATLRAESMANEAELKNARRAILELTRDEGRAGRGGEGEGGAEG